MFFCQVHHPEAEAEWSGERWLQLRSKACGHWQDALELCPPSPPWSQPSPLLCPDPRGGHRHAGGTTVSLDPGWSPLAHKEREQKPGDQNKKQALAGLSLFSLLQEKKKGFCRTPGLRVQPPFLLTAPSSSHYLLPLSLEWAVLAVEGRARQEELKSQSLDLSVKGRAGLGQSGKAGKGDRSVAILTLPFGILILNCLLRKKTYKEPLDPFFPSQEIQTRDVRLFPWSPLNY